MALVSRCLLLFVSFSLDECMINTLGFFSCTLDYVLLLFFLSGEGGGC